MARIDVLPSIEIIRGFKGILDFYVWRGLPCVRAWPKYRPARQTAASLAAALLFGAIVKSYNLLGDDALTAYRDDAADQPRTARDIMVTGAYGNLHEASMSDFLTLLTESRDFLSDLTALLNALDSIDTDELVVNVDQSVLPPLAATTTNQAIAIAALQKLDDLQDALQSKDLDQLIVRGEDQLFSLKDPLSNRRTAVISGLHGYCDSNTPAAGIFWIVTSCAARNQTNATTARLHSFRHAAVETTLLQDIRAYAQWEWSTYTGFVILAATDVIRVEFSNGQVGDTCDVDLTGYIMTAD